MHEAHVFVRPATPLDAPQIAAIHRVTLSAALTAGLRARLPESVKSAMSEELFSHAWMQAITAPPHPHTHVLCAVEEGKVCGFAALSPTYLVHENNEEAHESAQNSLPSNNDSSVFEITACEVHPRSERRGHGSRLLASCADTAKEEGADILQVWIIENDDAHIRFFQEAGFRPAGVRREYVVGEQTLMQHCWHARLHD